MPPVAANLFRLLPEDKEPAEAPPDIGLAQFLIERCTAVNPEAANGTLRASCIAVRIARRLGWTSRLQDLVHLASLGRQDLADNRDSWSISANAVLRIVVRECEDNADILTLVQLAFASQKLVAESGVFHGIDLLMKQTFPEYLLDAAWDLRYDEQTWQRLEERPAHESLLHAGRLGLSGVPVEDRAAIPIPATKKTKAA